MKPYLIIVYFLILLAYAASAQTTTTKKDSSDRSAKLSWLDPTPIKSINLKDANNYVGQHVAISGKVYGHRDFDNYILLDIGAAYPNQQITVRLSGEVLSILKARTNTLKVIIADGLIVIFEGKPQMSISERSRMSLLP
jgi:hypothetical protein